MDPRVVLMVSAAGRVAVGTVLLVAPGLASRTIGGESASPTTRVITRVAGIRDLVLGLGTLRAVASGDDPTDWVVASAACDATDAVAHLVAADALPRATNSLTVVGASGAAVVQLGALRRLTS